ncbi:Hypothetical predicted protein, partial [Paramuricea clavata]
MKTDFKVAFLILAVFCQLCCVDGWWSSRRSSSRRPAPSVRRPSVRKPTCALTNYQGSEFTGKTPRVHTGFLGNMRTINSYAQQCKVR